MYFYSRQQAGSLLARRMIYQYRYENCAVVTLNDGGVMVGAQIAQALHCIINVLLTGEITLPREPEAVGGITNEGSFIYNSAYSREEISDLETEFRGYIEQQKYSQMSSMNRFLSGSGLIDRDRLKGRNIILTADGLKTPFLLELAMEFFKPILIERLIVAVPVISTEVVDWLHVHADDIYVLTVTPNFIDTDHYYDKQDIPSKKAIKKTIANIVLNWK